MWKFIKRHQPVIFWGIFIGLILLRLWLITGVPKMLVYGPHDDLFYARAAQSMLRGQWMGLYNQMTLIKSPFYIFFMISSFFTGLPLFLNETLFYIGACGLMFWALKPLVKNPLVRLIGFFLMLFIPSSLASWFHLRVYREFVYFSLTLYVTACAIGLFLRLENKIAALLFWSLGLGISMGAFMLTREEGVWIYPLLFLLFTTSLIIIWRSHHYQKIWRSGLVLLPIILWYIPILLISWLNFSHYSFWGVTENLESEFNRVLKTLARIETGDDWHPAIQISQFARMAAYDASPTLAQYKEMIESYIPGWNTADDGAMGIKPAWYLEQFGTGGNEIGNGHFIWLIRDVAAHSGQYRDGVYPRDFYKQIADELEHACNQEALTCKPDSPLPALVGAIDRRHIPIIARMFAENLFRVINFDLVDINSMNISDSWPKWPQALDDYAVFEQFVYNPVDTINTARDESLPKNIYGIIDLRYRVIQYKESFMKSILRGYQLISLPFFSLGLVGWVYLMFTAKKHNYAYWEQFAFVSSFVLALLLTRLMTLTIIDATTSIPGIGYVASTHIFIPLFPFIVLIWCINTYKNNKYTLPNE